MHHISQREAPSGSIVSYEDNDGAAIPAGSRMPIVFTHYKIHNLHGYAHGKFSTHAWY